MKRVSLIIMRSAAVTSLVLLPVFATAANQIGQQHKPLPTAPLEQYDDPPAQAAFRVAPSAPSPSPTATPTSPSPTPTPSPTGTPGGTPTPAGTPTPTCCMLGGTVSTTCQYHSASNLFDVNISAMINNSCGHSQDSPANFYLEGSTDGSTFEFIVRTSIQNYTFQPGQNSINDAFLNQIIAEQYQYYRVRMQFYNCGIYFIYAPVAPVCRPGSTPTPAGTPTGTPIPSPTATATAAATPTPPPTVTISGTLLYCSNPSPGPVPSVTLAMTGTVSSSTLSNTSGNYLFSSLPSGGNYTVTPTKAALAPGSTGINTVDVVAIQRHFLNLGAPLSGCRLTAADVNGSTVVDTVDVIAVQRFFLTLSTGIANTGQYQFNPVSRSYPGIVSDQIAQNYDTLVFGDVTASYVH